MNNAKLYHKSNSLQKRDTLQCLKENSGRMNWKRNARILDIGCAEGGVTNECLKYFLPEDYRELIGCDISEKMVKFANTHNEDKRTSFIVLNIEDEIDHSMRGSFDNIFSFYCLHWIRNQEKAFRNIYELLSEQGDCLLLFVGQNYIYDVYRILATQRKWSKWLKDVDNYVSPYHESLDPVTEIREMLTAIGFHNIDVRCEDSSYTFEEFDVYKRSVKAVNPFKIPENLFEEFHNDYTEIVDEMKLIDRHNNNVNISFNYKLITVYASKSKLSTKPADE